MNPIDKIYWMKDNNKLLNNHHIHQYISTYMENSIIAELVIKDFSDDDQGEYSCIASNILGINTKSIQLLIKSTTTTTITSTTIESSTSRVILPRRKRPKHTRTTTVSSDSTEILREMTISSQGK